MAFERAFCPQGLQGFRCSVFSCLSLNYILCHSIQSTGERIFEIGPAVVEFNITDEQKVKSLFLYNISIDILNVQNNNVMK